MPGELAEDTSIMHRFITLSASVIAATLAFAVPAMAHDGGSALHKDRYLRALVVKVSGSKRAPGCDLIRHQCPKRTRTTQHAYLQTLRRMAGLLFDRPAAPVVQRGYAAPGNVTAGQASYQTTPPPYSGGGSSLANCIIRRESGGNPQAHNPNGHDGIGQWDQATWAAQGGTRYASTPQGASYGQQRAVLESALQHGGCSAWCPYDGCGG